MGSFIDNNGYLFDGNKPYTFYFDEGQSVNIFYDKTILYVTDSSSITISVPDDSVFKLIDMDVLSSSAATTEVNGFTFQDINYAGVQVTSLTLNDFQTINNQNIFQFNIITMSQTAGEFIDTFTITDNGVATEYNIGADFYNENEILRSNLENMGIEIPQSIQKAIYESDIHEDLMDNILMNRKWKELLLEYWPIFACKGNYNSLLNSLKWFEYGDLVKIQEYWKRNDNAKTIYRADEIGNNLDNIIRKQLGVMVKTSLIGLYCSRQHIVPNEFNDEDMPVIENVTFKFPIEDMMLKMTLLGNFYATYFTPIHLTVIHSTIENLVYANSIKLFNGTGTQRRDHVDNLGTFRCKTTGDFYIKPCRAYVYDDTIFGRTDYNITDPVTGLREYESDILGVDTKERIIDGNLLDNFMSVFAHYTLDLGAVVNFDVVIDDYVRFDDIIETATIAWKSGTGNIYNYSNRYVIYPVQDTDGKYKYIFNFELLFQRADTYNIFIEFESIRGIKYSKQFNIRVRDDIRNVVDIFKVKRYNPVWFKNIDVVVDDDNIDIINILNEYPDGGSLSANTIHNFMFDNLRNNQEYYRQTMLFNYDMHNNLEEIGFNHTLIIPIIPQTNLLLNIPATQFDPDFEITEADAQNPDTLIQNLKERFPHYWWIIKPNINLLTGTFIDYTDLNSDGDIPVLIGIRKYYSINTPKNIIYNRTYTYRDNTYEITILSGIINDNIIIKINGLVQESYFVKRGKTYNIQLHDTLGNTIHTLKITPNMCSTGTEFQYGLPKDRIFIRRTFTAHRIVDEDRFYPILHYLEPLNDGHITSNELCVAIPRFTISRDVDVDTWEFINVSNNKTYTVNHSQQPYITTNRLLTPGTYNIRINYRMDNTECRYSRDYAFIIDKNNSYNGISNSFEFC